jgi:hypothetical protein
MRVRFLIAALAVFTVGCGGQQLVVESNTSWQGRFGPNNTKIEGTGNKTFDIAGGDCWVIQKDTDQGRLRAYAKRKRVTGVQVEGNDETFAAFGAVSGCAGT